MIRVGLVSTFIFGTLIISGCTSPSTGSGPEYTAWDAIEAFLAEGLEAEGVTEMEPSDYGMAPMTAETALHFFVPSLCEDCGGRAYSFSSDKNQQKMKSYYEDLGKKSAIFFSWVLERHNVLVQINGDLPSDEAVAYQAALHEHLV